MDYTIVRLDAERIPDVHLIWERVGLPYRPDGRDSVAHIEHELRSGTAFLFGALLGDDLVGVVLGTDDGRKGWINRLAVVETRRRTGVGMALLQACETEFAARGIGLVSSLVESQNAASTALFALAGFAAADVSYFRKVIDSDEN